MEEKNTVRLDFFFHFIYNKRKEPPRLADNRIRQRNAVWREWMMATVTLGKTGITVNKNGFGALPMQRISKTEAVHLVQKAFDHGITFFDTARAYTDSEEKLGAAPVSYTHLDVYKRQIQ